MAEPLGEPALLSQPGRARDRSPCSQRVKLASTGSLLPSRALAARQLSFLPSPASDSPVCPQGGWGWGWGLTHGSGLGQRETGWKVQGWGDGELTKCYGASGFRLAPWCQHSTHPSPQAQDTVQKGCWVVQLSRSPQPSLTCMSTCSHQAKILHPTPRGGGSWLCPPFSPPPPQPAPSCARGGVYLWGSVPSPHCPWHVLSSL